ncbi:TetR/AcrR family transcriptional regulator [Halobacillus shinanisalinarum]|uniref:TetR/AcrR family transcriptional regulator n=1 Tax=Halobacillus shinanisalinarum TaxID=2932258 RepID=A0ABY4GTW2_9BACI|nr:TetR/AcrR family transcriptional regulator [Halobacillus shinanisalinarum]UOQ91586.1 TetR/AcrR family transcriptional regulator [Halobacillus shinanisalinarum]
MRRKDSDKERHILITAMRLFSSKSYNRTSMQEIADICGISKGSLYVYFKSKEDLLLNILQYYFQYIEDQIMLIEEDTSLSTTEKFMKEIEIKLGHYIENQEFYRLQEQELSGLSDQNIYHYLHQQNIAQVRWFEQYLIKIYGNQIKPYGADGAFLFIGMIKQYMELIVLKQFPLPIKKVVRFLMTQIDFMIKGLLDNDVEPLMNENLWSLYLEEANEEKVHPFELIKLMKNQLKTQSILEVQKDEAVQSLTIMEQELMNMKPRTAILKGMLHNLEPIDSLKETRVKLADSLQMN